MTGVEMHPERAATARRRFAADAQVRIEVADFLVASDERYDLIVGNPPYVSILGIEPEERTTYRAAYSSARGRFDLYQLFFEQALRQLRPGGRLVFITPEKYLYVEGARPLRALLARHRVEELHLAPEDTFGDLVTYPLITTVVSGESSAATTIRRRDGSVGRARLDTDDSWLARVLDLQSASGRLTLGDVALRVSCGAATGADQVFVLKESELPLELAAYAHPTIAGRRISPSGDLITDRVLLAPYDSVGRLIPERSLGALADYLKRPVQHELLTARTCVSRKRWYEFHDNFPIEAMRRPKLLCKDITAAPFFVVDEMGTIVPRHSVYYIVPAVAGDLPALAAYLNSPPAIAWLSANCQRAAKGFLRMQSSVLKRLPLPSSFVARVGSLAGALETSEARIA